MRINFWGLHTAIMAKQPVTAQNNSKINDGKTFSPNSFRQIIAKAFDMPKVGSYCIFFQMDEALVKSVSHRPMFLQKESPGGGIENVENTLKTIY